MAENGWPKVKDGDSYVKQMAELRRRIRGVYLLVVGLVLGQAIAMSGVIWKIDHDNHARSARFCLLAQQAITASTPNKPVSPLLIASTEVAGCRINLPPAIQTP